MNAGLPRRVGVVGLGLMGASLARGLKSRFRDRTHEALPEKKKTNTD